MRVEPSGGSVPIRVEVVRWAEYGKSVGERGLSRSCDGLERVCGRRRLMVSRLCGMKEAICDKVE